MHIEGFSSRSLLDTKDRMKAYGYSKIKMVKIGMLNSDSAVLLVNVLVVGRS